MVKTMKLWSVVVSSVLLVFAATTARADDEMLRLATSLCDYAKGNDRTMLRKKVKDANLSLRRIHGGILCAKDDKFSGGTLLRTAFAHNASESLEFIVSQVGSAGVSTPEHDGKTALQFAEEMAAADASKAPLLAIIKEKAGD